MGSLYMQLFGLFLSAGKDYCFQSKGVLPRCLRDVPAGLLASTLSPNRGRESDIGERICTKEKLLPFPS